MTGPTIAFTVALVFAPIQLEVLDLFPHQRGAAPFTSGTFFGLMLNAVLAGAIAPLVSTSLLSLALTSAGFALLGAMMWAWHLRAVRPSPAAPEPAGRHVGPGRTARSSSAGPVHRRVRSRCTSGTDRPVDSAGSGLRPVHAPREPHDHHRPERP